VAHPIDAAANAIVTHSHAVFSMLRLYSIARAG